jgi:hypothetical protein
MIFISRLVMPTDSQAVAAIHGQMLQKVRLGIQQITGMQIKVEPELAKVLAEGQDATKLQEARRNLNLQRMCLMDQARRLEERMGQIRNCGE